MTTSRPGGSLVTQRLSTYVVMLVWEDPQRAAHRRIAIELGGAEVQPPIARVTLPVEGGGRRTLIAFRPQAGKLGAADNDDGSIRILHRDGSVLAAIDGERGGAGDGEFDPFHLLDRLEGTGKVRLARFLLEPVRTVFRLDADPFYVVNMRHLIDALSPAPGPLVPCASVGSDLILCEAGVPQAIAPLQTAVTVGPRRIARAPFQPLPDDSRPGRRGFTPAWLMLRADAVAADRTVVIFGKGGFAIRQPARRGASPPSLLERRPGAPGPTPAARRYVLDCLGHVAEHDAACAALAREIAAFASPGSGSPSAPPVSLTVTSCVATGAGLFLAGKLSDRHGLVRGIAVRGAGFDADLPLDQLACLSGDARRSDGLGFVALAAMAGRAPRPNHFQCLLRLHSGAVVEGCTAPALDHGAAARAAILAALPATAVNASVIDRIVGPALEGVAAGAPDRPADVTSFGAPCANPAASLIVPFGRERALLLARAGALYAAASAFELIHVLDRPAARAGAEHSLAGLWKTFGLPGRLVCLSPAGDPATSMAQAASLARAERLVFLSEWAIPASGEALRPLLDVFDEIPEVGLSGARVLGADGSIRGAGLELAMDAAGMLSLDSPDRGLPGDFPAARNSRNVFAVADAALAIRRDLFDAVDGFAGGYATADWRAADLAGRVRAAGAQVRYVPSAIVTDFADRAAPRNAVALRADGWRFARVWSSRLADWTVAPASGSSDQLAAAPAGTDAARWAA